MSRDDILKDQLGRKIKSLRTSMKLSSEELAEKSGVNVETLNGWESGADFPRIDELMNLASVLSCPLGDFFADELGASKVEFVKADQRWKATPHTKTAASLDYQYEALSFHMSDKKMVPFLVKIPPSKNKKISPSKHDGEEFIHVIKGKIHAKIGDQDYDMESGDSLYFDPRVEHVISCRGTKMAELIVCLVHPNMSSEDDPDLERAFG